MKFKLIIMALACYNTVQAGLSVPEKNKKQKTVSLMDIIENNDASHFGSINCRKQLLVNLARRDLTNIDGIEFLEINKKPITKFTELELRVDKSFLTTLPDSIGLLTNIIELDLCLNKLTNLPESIGNLKQLYRLYLMDNKLTALPNSIGNLTNLEFCYLASNCLKQVPDSINNLVKIRQLNLRGNKLVKFPDGKLKELANLNGYNLDDDPNKFIQIQQSNKAGLMKYLEIEEE